MSRCSLAFLSMVVDSRHIATNASALHECFTPPFLKTYELGTIQIENILRGSKGTEEHVKASTACSSETAEDDRARVVMSKKLLAAALVSPRRMAVKKALRSAGSITDRDKRDERYESFTLLTMCTGEGGCVGVPSFAMVPTKETKESLRV